MQKIIVAIDEFESSIFKKTIDCLDSSLCMVKIGSVAFNSLGHEVIDYVAKMGFDIFLDLKLHDIPNTVKKSVEVLRSLPSNMLTVHISGGENMISVAVDAVEKTGISIIGVTALTSLSDDDTFEIYKRSSSDQVNCMLDMAEKTGIHGVVCSPHELKQAKKRNTLLTVIPGISFIKVMMIKKECVPKEAINLGADYIVIGRPITQSGDISKSLLEIYESIN